MKLAHSILWIVLLGSSVRAQTTRQTLAHWTFESNPVPTSITGSSIGPIAPEIGSGQLRGWHTSASTAWSTTVAGNGSGRSLNSNRWAVGDYYEFQVPAPGTGRLAIEWHQTRSSTGPAQFALQYSTDGSTFQDATTYTITEDVWSAGSPQPKPQSIFLYAFPADDPANDEDNITFRLVALTTPGATVGASRIDNVKVTSGSGLFVTVAGRQVEVQRWGTGPKGVIFFSHTGSIANAFRSNTALVESLVSRGYSVFVWDYPGALLNPALNALDKWSPTNSVLPIEERPVFSGAASTMLAQIRAATGLQNFVLVGNSLGAGVVLSDYEILVQDSSCQMLLISPTEPFIPPNLPPVLQKSFMVSDAFNDFYLRRQEDKEFCARNSNLPFPDNMSQPGHIVLTGAATIEYAFQLLDQVFAPRMISAAYSKDGRFSMSWTPASGLHVQRSLDLNKAGWTTVLSNVTGTNYLDDATPAGSAFYRLVVP
jgi:pimeloyl-ACP methyl ester carboxylesterase